MDQSYYAPGQPGISPRWNSSKKSGVGTSLNNTSRVWFSTSHGILNEVYYPRVDTACLRDMGFMVSDGDEFFSEEKRHTNCEIKYLSKGIPAYHFTNSCRQGRYKIEKDILVDPARDVLIQRIKFSPSKNMKDLHLYALISTHISNVGTDNNAWVGDYKGHEMLFAQRDGIAVAMACSAPWIHRTVGFVGSSDAWNDVSRNKKLTRLYQKADDGNVAMCGEINWQEAEKRTFLLTIGFGRTPNEAGQRALTSIQDGYENAKEEYLKGWKSWQEKVSSISTGKRSPHDLFKTSAAIIKAHEEDQFPGGIIASLSVPWGFSKGDNDLGGYHLVWPRDLVEAAGGLLAGKVHEEPRRVMNYLRSTQEADGHWLQNMWLDGSPYWTGIQLDEVAFPILLADMLIRNKAIAMSDTDQYYDMIKKAVTYLIGKGPSSPQDRWEEVSGYSPFTLAVEIAALLAAADIIEYHKENDIAAFLRETADIWNANIEKWTYVKGTELAKKVGVDGYYIRVAPLNIDIQAKLAGASKTAADDIAPIKNVHTNKEVPAQDFISTGALALVRFGLRDANDERIVNTVKVIDELLKVKTPFGDAWHRYNHDSYGEHKDGSPFDGSGIGRLWPLLTGERGHYEIASGNIKQAKKLLDTMGAFSNEGGMIPEQIWDTDDIPEKELYFGRPSGSAMPLVWAHAEYMKLCRSIKDKKVFDTPSQTTERYLTNKHEARHENWRFTQQIGKIAKGKTLRILTNVLARVHWSHDDWDTVRDTKTVDSKLGLHYADLDTDKLESGDEIKFTFYWPASQNWENNNFKVIIE